LHPTRVTGSNVQPDRRQLQPRTNFGPLSVQKTTRRKERASGGLSATLSINEGKLQPEQSILSPSHKWRFPPPIAAPGTPPKLLHRARNSRQPGWRRMWSACRFRVDFVPDQGRSLRGWRSQDRRGSSPPRTKTHKGPSRSQTVQRQDLFHSYGPHRDTRGERMYVIWAVISYGPRRAPGTRGIRGAEFYGNTRLSDRMRSSRLQSSLDMLDCGYRTLCVLFGVRDLRRMAELWGSDGR